MYKLTEVSKNRTFADGDGLMKSRFVGASENPMKSKFCKSAARWLCSVLSVFLFGVVENSFGQTLISNYNPVVGQPHFDFSLPDINDGKLKKLSDFRGKKVLLLHFASW